MAFIDELILKLRAGNGGNGVVRWRHEKFKPLAGPGGGNAGRGGDVFAVAYNDNNLLSTNYRVKKEFSAENGQNGQSNGKEGKKGDDLYLSFPIGTVLTNLKTGEKIDLLVENEPVKLLKGGVGGLGNEHFKGSKNQSPTQSTNGKPGEEAEFQIELRLIADIGLVGLPNAGKSTLLNMISNADAKVGDYPFTTLEPNLGVFDNLIIADIPGLIEGASVGKGLGDRFLKHIMRTRFLVHLVSAEDKDPVNSIKIIEKELNDFNPELTEKKKIIVLSKCDTKTEQEIQDIKSRIDKKFKSDAIIFSAFSESDLINLKEKIRELARN